VGHVPDDTVTTVLAHALARPARLGATRLVCVDGPSGSGKTVLADAVAAEAATRGLTVATLHADELLDGWDGLPDLPRRMRRLVLEPLAAGRPARYRRYDWHRGCFGDEHELPVVDLLLLDGVGSGSAVLAGWRSTLVWVASPDPEERLARALARDGEEIREQLLRWRTAEEEHFRASGLPARADLRVDGAGALVG
jgi:hypothetical protein